MFALLSLGVIAGCLMLRRLPCCIPDVFLTAKLRIAPCKYAVVARFCSAIESNATLPAHRFIENSLILSIGIVIEPDLMSNQQSVRVRSNY